MTPRSRPLRALAAVAAGGTLVGVSLTLLIQLTGCARNSEVQAGDLETRLTFDGEGKLYPFFSPDGKSVLYTNGVQVLTDGNQYRRLQRVSVAGGDPETITADSSAFHAIGWFPDGKTLLIRAGFEDRLDRIDTRGAVQETYPLENVTQVLGIEPSGKGFLTRTFNGSTFDVGLKTLDGASTVLAETPEWELDACYGPGPDEVTVASYALPGSETNRLRILSRTTGTFRDLPVREALNIGACWSPDGNTLAYASQVEGNMDLWLFDATSGNEIRVTSGTEDEVTPRWSPDGEQIVFIKRTRFSNIWIADTETHESRQLTRGDAFDFEAWPSPDGARVVFVREHRTGESSRLSLQLAFTETGTVQEIPLIGCKLSHVGLRPAWSPDGTEVAFTGVDEDGQVDVYRVDLEGGVPVQVTIGSGVEVYPTWSPDGRTILFTRLEGGESQLWSVPATGGLSKRLSNRPGINGWAAWADDSDRFAYLSVREGQGSETWLTSLSNPQDQTMVTESETIVVPLAWSNGTDEILIWRQIDEGGHLCAIRPDGTGERAVADQDRDTNEGSAFRFRPGEESYRSICYDSDIYTFSRSRTVADLYLLRVADFLSQTRNPNPGAE